jgi:hypothetical protein
MANDLSRQIQALSEAFVRSVIAALRAGSVEDILFDSGNGPSAKRGPGRPRKHSAAGVTATKPPTNATRSTGRSTDTAATMEAIVAYVRGNPGANGETTRKALGIPRNRWSSVVRKAVDAGKLRTVGEKRARRYWGT